MPEGENSLRPLRNEHDRQMAMQKAQEVRDAYSKKIAKINYNIQTHQDGNDYITLPDGSSFKVEAYSFGVPVVDYQTAIEKIIPKEGSDETPATEQEIRQVYGRF